MFAIDQGVLAILRREKIKFALIGASACAAHGLARYSADVDLLTIDARVLNEDWWPKGADVRRGDIEDPLRGVVRFETTPPLDVIVGKGYAARFALDTAVLVDEIAIATPAALILLKLEAGGAKDRYDILGLADAQRVLGRPDLVAQVTPHLAHLSRDAQNLWNELEPKLTRA